MVNECLNRYSQNANRHYTSFAVAFVVGLFVILPEWDGYSAARQHSLELKTELLEKSRTLANKDLMRSRLNRIQAHEIASQEMIDQEAAQRIREDVMHLVRKTNCQMKRLTVSDPHVREWMDNDDPFTTHHAEHGKPTGFVLESRVLDVAASGDLQQLSGLIVALNRLDTFSVPTEMTLQRVDDNGHLRMNASVSLFNLVEKND